MNKKLFFLCFILSLFSCSSGHYKYKNMDRFVGIYESSDSTHQQLQLYDTYQYVIYNTHHEKRQSCAYMGEWTQASKKLLNIRKKKDLKYNVSMNHQFSRDTLYFEILLNKAYNLDKYPLYYRTTSVKPLTQSGDVTTDVIKMKIPDYMKSMMTSEFSFMMQLYKNVYKYDGDISNMINLSILEDYINLNIDLRKGNYVTIDFSELTPEYYESASTEAMLYIKDKNTLLWDGREWNKQ